MLLLKYTLLFYFVQLLGMEKSVVRQWTTQLSAASVLRVEKSDIKAHGSGRQWNITRQINTNHSVMPVLRGMPIAKAELKFHEYV